MTVRTWLMLTAFLVFIMVLIGGYTRLTHAGLSIVEWKPVSGAIPPLNDAAWDQEFMKYQSTPEFQKINPDINLSEFKILYWIEFFHRLWGRLIGLFFFIPLLWYLYRKQLDRPLQKQLAVIALLGAAQAFMGWFMVKSGLVHAPFVSPYRLAAHLLMALLLLTLIIRAAAGSIETYQAAPLRRYGYVTLGILALTIFFGALVAGMRAGLIYNTFPLMAGDFLPSEAWYLEPLYRNFFENPTMVQFIHRVLAFFSLTTVILLSLKGFGDPHLKPLRRLFFLMLCLVVLQFTLGILTLLSVLELPYALAHQGGAFLLFVSVYSFVQRVD